jgi:hypothetical protein
MTAPKACIRKLVFLPGRDGVLDEGTCLLVAVGLEELGRLAAFLVGEAVLAMAEELVEVGHQPQGLRISNVAVGSLKGSLWPFEVELSIILVEAVTRIKDQLKPFAPREYEFRNAG